MHWLELSPVSLIQQVELVGDASVWYRYDHHSHLIEVYGRVVVDGDGDLGSEVTLILTDFLDTLPTGFATTGWAHSVVGRGYARIGGVDVHTDLSFPSPGSVLIFGVGGHILGVEEQLTTGDIVAFAFTALLSDVD